MTDQPSETESAEPSSGKSGSSRSPLLEGLLLASTPVIAYGMAFAYERGYASHFGYPDYLIQVSLVTALVAWAALLAAGMTLLTLILIFSIITSIRVVRTVWVTSRLIFHTVWIPLWVGLMMYFTIAAFGPKLVAWGVGGVFVLAGLLDFWFVLKRAMKHRRESRLSLLEILDLMLRVRVEKEGGPLGPRDSIFERLTDIPGVAITGFIGSLLIGVSYLALQGATHVGRLEARRELVFLVDQTDSLVVLRGFGDYLVTATLTADDQFAREYVIIPKADPGARTFTSRQFETLRPDTAAVRLP